MVLYRGRRSGMVVATASLVLGALAAPSIRGEEPGRLGRLFRLGGPSRPAEPSSAVKPKGGEKPDGPARSLGSTAPVPSPNIPYTPTTPATISAPLSSPTESAGSRLKPQPRVSRAVTEAEPLVTRISIGRTDDGKQFCMFVQIFADGTVLDSDGVHRVGAEHLRPIAQILQAGEIAQIKGHCGGPATDFIEQVHLVAYDHNRGRLRATAISYTGNPQGCDPSVRQMNAAIDAIQAKLSGVPSAAPASAATSAPTSNAAPSLPAYGSATPAPPVEPFGDKSITLTPDS